MAIISDVKCGKCDRRYSGLRGRCPYCGARRGKAGKHAPTQGNTTGKIILGLILLAILLAAVVILVLAGNKNRTAPGGKTDPKSGETASDTTPGSVISNDEDVTSVEGDEYVPAEQPEEPSGDAETPENEDGEMTAPEELGFPWQGTVKASSVNVRSGAGRSYKEVTYATSGQKVTVVDQTQGENITDSGASSDIWYKIEITINGVKYEGYLNSLFVEKTE